MKKTFIAIIAFLAMSASAFAGQQNDSTRYLATKAWKNWFISADGNIDWWKGSDKNPAGNYTAINGASPHSVATSTSANGSPTAWDCASPMT